MARIIRCFLALWLIASIPSYALSQTPKSKTVIQLAPGITNPVSYPNKPGQNRITTCDNPDVRIFPSNRPQSEIHISINKQNPQVLLLSSNTFPLFNSWQGAYWSTDGGATWTGSDDLPNNGFGRGDPSTAFDAAGNGYIATMNAPGLNDEPNGYLVQRTATNGANWQPQVAATGILDNFDKEMIAADNLATSPFANNLYCSWSRLFATPANNSVQFNRSTNQGASFSTPVTLKTGWGQGTNVQTGPNGEVYVCWADYNNSTTDWTSHGLGFCRSTDGGITFSAAQRVINYTGIRTYNSTTTNDQNPLYNNIRVNDFPSMSVDKSNGGHRGRIYAVFPVRENGNGRGIIQMAFSDNQGTSWSTPVTISIANATQSWFPWIAVDDSNGDVFVVYYALDEAGNFNTNTYVASSNDGGATFVNQRVSDQNHVTAPIAEFGGGYAGDYIGITAFGGRAFASWMDNRTGQWQIYVSEVRDLDVVGDNSFCTTSNTYSVTNLPANATVQWQTSPAGIATPNCPTCPQTTLSKNGNGTITLTAVVTNACNGTQIQVPKQNIIVGSLTPGAIQTGPSTPIDIELYINPVAGASSYNWYKSGVMVPSQHETFVDIPVTCNITYQISVESVNSCGASSRAYKNVKTACWGGAGAFSVSPNPASATVTISAKNTTSIQSGNKSYSGFDEVRIFDATGNFKKKLKFDKAKTVNINVSDLISGTYFVEIVSGNYIERQQLLIQK